MIRTCIDLRDEVQVLKGKNARVIIGLRSIHSS